MSKRNKIIIITIPIILILLGVILLVFGNKEEELTTYIVTFDSKGGTETKKQEVAENDMVNKPADPSKEGYLFVGWIYDGKMYDFNKPVTSNMNLDASWEINSEENKKFVVSFDTIGGTIIPNQIVKKGETIVRPSDPEREGYQFKGWYMDGQPFDFSVIVIETTQLKAQWEKIEVKPSPTPTPTATPEETVKPVVPKPISKKYTVNFDTKGGTAVGIQKIVENGTLKKPTDPTRRGYSFVGWTLNDKLFDFNTKITKNMTLVAKWEKEKKKYKMTFDGNGGICVVKTATVVENSLPFKPADPEREGYKFIGWKVDGKLFDFNTKITKDITLVAVWEEIPAKKVTVTFDTAGGNTIASITVNEGKTIAKPANPTKSGFTFNNWLLNGQPFDFTQKVTANITLKASWTQKTYTISTKPVDAYSPDVILTVKENGTPISVKEIQYLDGIKLCDGTNTTVGKVDIDGETSFKLILIDGGLVTATLSK